jgi:hypothetical protein
MQNNKKKFDCVENPYVWLLVLKHAFESSSQICLLTFSLLFDGIETKFQVLRHGKRSIPLRIGKLLIRLKFT